MVKNQPKWPKTTKIPDFMKNYLRGHGTQSSSTKECQLSWCFLQIDKGAKNGQKSSQNGPKQPKNYLRGSRTQGSSTKECQLSWCFLQIDFSLQLKAIGRICVE
jgi:hypothetical protein